MGMIVTGIALGLVVSMPPGPNSVLCVNLASGGLRRAMPLITGAAITDAAYSLLAASGILFANRVSSGVLSVLAPIFMLGAALLVWSPASLSAKAALGIAVLNPATAAIWIGLSSMPAAHAPSVPEVLLRPLPVALGTALWFTLLALIAARVSIHLSSAQIERLQRLLAAGLAAGGLLSLIPIL